MKIDGCSRAWWVSSTLALRLDPDSDMLWAGYGGSVSTRSSSNDEYVGHRAHVMLECWRRSTASSACISGMSGRQSQEIHLNEPMCRHSYYYLATNYFKPQALAVGVWSLKVL